MTSRPNPYHPGFGVDPSALAGRDDQIAATLAALRAGSQAPGFCQALLGDRGVGKTVLLNEIERRCRAELRWPVVTHQATPGGDLVASIAEKLPSAVGRSWSRAGRLVRDLDKEITLSANLGVLRAETKMNRPSGRAQPADLLERLLRTAGDFAAKRRSGILVTIDEAHVIERVPDLAALGAAMQLVVRRARLPVAVILAGLPQLRAQVHGIGTFLERIDTTEIGSLGPDATRYALIQPAAELGVSFDAAALDILVSASGGYPYLVQVLGYETWQAAAGAARLTTSHAHAGRAAGLKRRGALFKTRWDQLSDLEQRYITAIARHNETSVPVAAVATALRRSTQQLSTTRAGLIEGHRLVVSPRYGHVQLALAGFGLWVRGLGDDPDRHPGTKREPRAER